MAEEDYKSLLKEVFGEWSSSDTEDEYISLQIPQQPNSDQQQQSQNTLLVLSNWERVAEINGLWVCRDLLSLDQQSSLLSAIESEGWFTQASHNQAMRFGDLPVWATKLADIIHKAVHISDYSACLFPSNLLWREPLFDQLIVNVYQPGEGICAHVDLLRFEDGIAIVSLESPCVMHFTRVENGVGSTGKESESEVCMDKVAVYLTPGSLVLMSGEARYQWKHGINRNPGFQKWMGKDIDQRRRISITLRKLCPQ